MKMAEARAAIGDAISTAIKASFERDLQRFRETGYTPRRPAAMHGGYAPGHDAARVPHVPRTELRINRDAGRPSVIFT
jgi:hypothetical protein